MLRESDRAKLPSIQVSPLQGRFLHLLARMQGARRILEVGTLGGYSTLWLARALPAGGRLVSLELDSRHALVAQRNLQRAGVTRRVEIRVGPARVSLEAMVARGEGPFDLIFIDADKPNNPVYVELALALARKGTAIVVDNVVRKGKVSERGSRDPSVVGTRKMIGQVARDTRVEATAIQTVGSKGHDGFLLIRVLAPVRRSGAGQATRSRVR